MNKEEDVIFEETATTQSKNGFELVPFDEVLNSLQNPEIRANLADLKQKALAGRGDAFNDLQLFEKFEYRDYTHYSLFVTDYTIERPYYLFLYTFDRQDYI